MAQYEQIRGFRKNIYNNSDDSWLKNFLTTSEVKAAQAKMQKAEKIRGRRGFIQSGPKCVNSTLGTDQHKRLFYEIDRTKMSYSATRQHFVGAALDFSFFDFLERLDNSSMALLFRHAREKTNQAHYAASLKRNSNIDNTKERNFARVVSATNFLFAPHVSYFNEANTDAQAFYDVNPKFEAVVNRRIDDGRGIDTQVIKRSFFSDETTYVGDKISGAEHIHATNERENPDEYTEKLRTFVDIYRCIAKNSSTDNTEKDIQDSSTQTNADAHKSIMKLFPFVDPKDLALPDGVHCDILSFLYSSVTVRINVNNRIS